MKNFESERWRVGWLPWSGRHSDAFSLGGSLLSKLAILGTGVCFVYWVGWPQPSLSSVPSPAMVRLSIPASHTGPIGSADHPHAVMRVVSHSGKEVVGPLHALVEGKHGSPREVVGFTVDVNESTSAELEHLPGIGPVLAERIVAHRLSHGAFRHIDDLVHVPGIGVKRLEQLRPFVGIRISTRELGIGS